MVNFGILAAEIVSGVWGTPATFNCFRVLAPLLHGSQVVSVSQTMRRWTERATYVWQGDHHVGHWPTFLVMFGCMVVSAGYLGKSFGCWCRFYRVQLSWVCIVLMDLIRGYVLLWCLFSIYTVFHKKPDSELLSVNLSNLSRFSKFFHC